VTTFLSLTVVGVVVGCIYALSATGLVVTYITSGIFNFAHGAVGMVAAFEYWTLTHEQGWPAWVALLFCVLVFAPLLGVLVDVAVMRNLHTASEEVRLIVTVGLMIFLLAVADTIWTNDKTHRIEEFFAGNHVRILGVEVTYHQLLVVGVAVAIAVGLRLFLFRTRTGVALRAVVDAPDLAAMFGAAPAKVRMLGWAIGSSLAALAGILIAPLITLDSILLTLLVINGYAAAIVGRLKSLPLTFAGGVALGLLEAYAVKYIPIRFLSQVRPAIPTVFLFVALLALPQVRLRVGRALARAPLRVPSLRNSAVAAVLLVIGSWILAANLNTTNLFRFGTGLALAIIMLSLVLLTGYGGQISLAQMTFAGFGAFAMGRVAGGDSVWGLLAAMGFGAVGGVVAALPALRLRGLYLALSTFAFAWGMRNLFFNNNNIFSQGGAQKVGRLDLFGISFAANRTFVVLIAFFLAAAIVGVLAVRRSSFGRRLTAMADSQVACATLGMSLTWTKLIVFAGSAALAGLGGAFYGGLRGSIGTNDVNEIQSLIVFLLLAIWGVDAVIAAVLAGILFAFFPLIGDQTGILNFTNLSVGLGAIGIGRNPGGVVRAVVRDWNKLRARLQRRGPEPEVAAELAFLPTAAANGNGHARPTPALELIGVRSGYDRIEVVHGVDLAVPPATVFALLGPNGAGKSTLLRVAGGNHPAWEGCVHVAGIHVNGAPPEQLARLGVCTVPEGRPIFANLTVAENIRMMSFRAGVPASDIEERAYAAFPRLAERPSQLAGSLSGGEQQMLAMARAVGTDPKLLLLDEISLGLAPKIVAQLYEHVADLKEQGLSILLVEQFVQTAMSVADYVGVMSQGRIQQMGESADVTDAVSAAYMGAVG
jgi:branched-chain amino acid transport system permease protein